MVKKKVLVIEDDGFIVRDMQKTLNKMGYDAPVTSFSNEGSTESILETKPDLVVMGSILSEGTKDVEAAQEIYERFHIPVIHLTEYSDEETRQRTKISKSDGYILKPFGEKDLQSSIEMALYKYNIHSKLKESEKGYKDLSDLLPQIVFETDLQGNLTYVNRSGLEMTGYSKEESLNGFNCLDIIIPRERPRAMENIRRVLSGENIGGKEYTFMRKNGSTLPVIIYSSPIFKDGKPFGLRGIIVDITDRKKAEEVVLRRDRQLEILSNSAQKLNSILEIPKILRTLVDSAMKLVEANLGTVGLVEDGKIIFTELSREGNLSSIRLIFEPGNGIPGRIMQKKIPYISNDPQNNSIVNQRIRDLLDYKNVLCIPIINGKKDLVGCLELFDTKDGRPFDSQDIEMLQILVSSATTAFENAKHLEDVKIVQDALINSEKRYRLLFNKSKDLIMVHKMEMDGSPGLFMEINDSVCEKLEYSKEELLNLTPKDIRENDTADSGIPEGLMRGRESRYERTLVSKCGKKIIVEFNSFRLRFNGEDCILAIGRDITQRKRAEEELRKSEERYRTLVYNISDLIIELDSELTITYVSPQIYNMFGFTSSEVIGRSALDFLHPEDTDGAMESVELALVSKEVLEFEFRIRHKNGHYIEVVMSEKIIDSEGDFRIIGLVRDLSVQRSAQITKQALIKEKSRAEISSFMVSALPTFATNIPFGLRDGMVKTFAERFERYIKPKFNNEFGASFVKSDDPTTLIGAYLSWLSRFLFNIGFNTELNSSNDENRIEIMNCPWIENARENPIFCFLCRTIMIRSFTWTGIKGCIEQTRSKLEEGSNCRFEIYLMKNSNNGRKTENDSIEVNNFDSKPSEGEIGS